MEFGFWGWVVRWMLAMFIVLATYNPTGYFFWHWVVQSGLQNASVKVLAALILLLLHLIYLRATIRSIGPIGIGLITATLGAFAWWLSDLELIDMGNRVVVDLVLLVMFATLMSIGISWSHLRNRLSGQIDSDDVTTPTPV